MVWGGTILTCVWGGHYNMCVGGAFYHNAYAPPPPSSPLIQVLSDGYSQEELQRVGEQASDYSGGKYGLLLEHEEEGPVAAATFNVYGKEAAQVRRGRGWHGGGGGQEGEMGRLGSGCVCVCVLVCVLCVCVRVRVTKRRSCLACGL